MPVHSRVPAYSYLKTHFYLLPFSFPFHISLPSHTSRSVTLSLPLTVPLSCSSQLLLPIYLFSPLSLSLSSFFSPFTSFPFIGPLPFQNHCHNFLSVSLFPPLVKPEFRLSFYVSYIFIRSLSLLISDSFLPPQTSSISAALQSYQWGAAI